MPKTTKPSFEINLPSFSKLLISASNQKIFEFLKVRVMASKIKTGPKTGPKRFEFTSFPPGKLKRKLGQQHISSTTSPTTVIQLSSVNKFERLSWLSATNLPDRTLWPL